MKEISVSVVYALPGGQEKIELSCPEGTTIIQAIAMSGIKQKITDLDLDKVEVGVYGFRRDHEYRLEENDRVEIYRPLVLPPTEARRLRAAARMRKSGKTGKVRTG